MAAPQAFNVSVRRRRKTERAISQGEQSSPSPFIPTPEGMGFTATFRKPSKQRYDTLHLA